MNVYVIHGIARDIPLGTIFRGVVPFFVSDLVHLAMLIAFPAITLWLPVSDWRLTMRASRRPRAHVARRRLRQQSRTTARSC